MSLDRNLDALVDTIRAADGAADAGAEADELAVATRLRVMRSLEVRARGRHQLIGFATAIAILLGGTVSWALATGQVAALWSPSPVSVSPRPVAAPSAAPPRPAHRPPPRPPAMSVDPRPTRPLVREPPEAIPPALPAQPVASPRPVAPPRPLRHPAATVEVLYRRAHELHFHASDPAVALAAWDAYLAAEPDGRFAVEARYNRALVLVRLGRYAEARAALAPFARGAAAPAGYRQSEAEQLVERLARYE